MTETIQRATLTWKELTRLEPRLEALYHKAKNVKDDRMREAFCANCCWYGYGRYEGEGFKPQLLHLVGFQCDIPELKTMQAYDLAYRRIYDVLPPCRNCNCYGMPEDWAADEAEKAIKEAKMTHLELCCWGMKNNEHTHNEFVEARSAFEPKNVATSIAYLRKCCQPVKKPEQSSYFLKHQAERWDRIHNMQPYVTNGELIAAAVYLGLKIKPLANNPNVNIAVKLNDPAAIYQ
jgi:hypothetical protein